MRSIAPGIGGGLRGAPLENLTVFSDIRLAPSDIALSGSDIRLRRVIYALSGMLWKKTLRVSIRPPSAGRKPRISDFFQKMRLCALVAQVSAPEPRIPF